MSCDTLAGRGSFAKKLESSSHRKGSPRSPQRSSHLLNKQPTNFFDSMSLIIWTSDGQQPMHSTLLSISMMTSHNKLWTEYLFIWRWWKFTEAIALLTDGNWLHWKMQSASSRWKPGMGTVSRDTLSPVLHPNPQRTQSLVCRSKNDVAYVAYFLRCLNVTGWATRCH